MVAGKGSRLRCFTDKPKSTLEVKGMSIIRRNVKLLLSKNIKVALVIGYKCDYIKECLFDLEVEYYYNPFFDVTNSIASLWFTKEFLQGDILLFNGDVYFDEKLLDNMLKDERDVVMLCDKSRVLVGDYFFKTDKKGILLEYGKDLKLEERSSEYVGFAKISNDFLESFKKRLEELINLQKHDLWWENVLYSYVGERDIYTIDTEGIFWGEIDTFDDYQRILKHTSLEEK